MLTEHDWETVDRTLFAILYKAIYGEEPDEETIDEYMRKNADVREGAE